MFSPYYFLIFFKGLIGVNQLLVQIRKILFTLTVWEKREEKKEKEEREGRKSKISPRTPRDSSGIRQG